VALRKRASQMEILPSCFFYPSKVGRHGLCCLSLSFDSMTLLVRKRNRPASRIKQREQINGQTGCRPYPQLLESNLQIRYSNEAQQMRHEMRFKHLIQSTGVASGILSSLPSIRETESVTSTIMALLGRLFIVKSKMYLPI